MNDENVRFPVTCPACGAESLHEMSVADVVGAYFDRQALRLYSPCHDQWWTATQNELAQFREYIGAVWLAEREKGNSRLADAKIGKR